MTYRQTLPRGWVTVGVSGTPHPRGATYVRYDASQLPDLPSALGEGDGLEWLRDLPELTSGMMPDEYGYVTTPFTAEGVRSLLAGADVEYGRLPMDLRALLSEPSLHRRLFSATDAYFDAGQHLEPVPGGHLLHLVSDSQWVCHWLAFIADDGGSGVVCSHVGLGYAHDEEDMAARADEPINVVWVADSVTEFVWRWWADNYLFARAHPDMSPPLHAPGWFEAAEYAAGYGPAAGS
jgi:hypothetical protein